MRTFRLHTAVALTSLCLAGTACGGGNSNAGTSTTPAAAVTTTPSPSTTTTTAPVATPTAAAPVTPEHHSKLGGAAAGALAGHMIGGKKGMLAGAVAGAVIQHERNKHAAAAAANP